MEGLASLFDLLGMMRTVPLNYSRAALDESGIRIDTPPSSDTSTPGLTPDCSRPSVLVPRSTRTTSPDLNFIPYAVLQTEQNPAGMNYPKAAFLSPRHPLRRVLL